MSRKVIIDGDSISYIAGYSKSHGEAEACVTRLISQILIDTNCTSYELYIEEWRKDKDLFRRRIWDGYKLRKKDKNAIPFLDHSRVFMVQKWHAKVVTNYEAEDVVLRRASELRAKGGEIVIAYIDKDLLQYPGEFYYYGNISKKPEGFNRTTVLTGDEAVLRLWRQVVTGDQVDTVPGVFGVGPAGANKAIKDPSTAMEDAVCVYKSKTLDYDYFIRQYNMIKLRDVETDEILKPLTREEYEQI
jgi:hypothetical protein